MVSSIIEWPLDYTMTGYKLTKQWRNQTAPAADHNDHHDDDDRVMIERVHHAHSHGPRLIGVDLAGILGGRMARAEGGLVPSEVEYAEGCPLFSRLGGLGERRELPQRGPRPKTDFGVF